MSDRRVKAVIDLKAARQNLINLYEHMDKPVPILCVIKANGYGHGAIRLAKMYEEMPQVCGYATATAEEALALRSAGVKKMILILGVTFEEDFKELILNDVDLTVFTLDTALKINDVARNLGKKANIHIKADTGMTRIGLTPDETGAETVKKISQLSNVNIKGLFTHYAKADELDKTSAKEQLSKYKHLSELIEDEGINIPIHHTSNSAALLELPEARFDMVRAGIVLYGLWPSDEIVKENISLKPVMSLVSHVAYVKTVKNGVSVSYGGTFTSNKEMKIATIPVGYADGYPRMLSNKGHVIIKGCFAPILGRVCMDQMMVDVTEIPDVYEGEEVILMGSDGKKTITAEEIGELSSRFNYELVCDITSRVPRVYIE